MTTPDRYAALADPVAFKNQLWPEVTFYDKQWEVIFSVEQNDETLVPAGNQLGKDFVAGFIVLRFFLVHHPVRVVTTSVKDDHLRVLWGEIGRFVNTCRVPLRVERGGPLVVNHRELRKVVGGVRCPISYAIGMVSENPEGLAGHHAPNTLLVLDEASGVQQKAYDQGRTWAKRVLAISNCNPCDNFFREGVEAGDLLAPDDTPAGSPGAA
jgi:hypothetical protein